MAFVTTDSLNRLSDWITRNLLTDSGDILREVRTPNASGGATLTFPVVMTVPCAVLDVSRLRPQERLGVGQQIEKIEKLILVPAKTAILGTDRIQVKSEGIIYHIIDLFEPSTLEVVRRLLVRRSSLGER